MGEHYRTLSAVFPVILKEENGKTMVLLHRRQNTGYQDGKLDFAGSGHVDEGETATMAVVRECREELGISVAEDDLSFAHLSHRISARIYYDIYFLVRQYTGSPRIREPDKCAELSWYDIDALPHDMILCRKLALLDYKKGVYYSEITEDM